MRKFVCGFIRGVLATIIIVMALAAVIAVANAGIPVPPECTKLAIREGFPPDFLTDEQADRARRRMRWLRFRHPFDPLVKECRAGIKRMQPL